MKKVFEWDKEKNRKLIEERNISFESIVAAIETGNVLAVVPGKEKYRHQKQFIVWINNYAYIVPYVEDNHKVFLKTVIPSRKLTKKYLFGGRKP